jgi:hypothetical protein
VSAVSWSNGQTGNSLVVNASGTYTATYVTNNGCTVTSNPVTVAVNPIPQPVISSGSGQLAFCTGGSLVLNASTGASGYQWFRNGTAVTGAEMGDLNGYTLTFTATEQLMALFVKGATTADPFGDLTGITPVVGTNS